MIEVATKAEWDAQMAAAGDKAVACVRVPNRFKLDWIRTQYAGRIESVLSELAGEPVQFELGLLAREVPAGQTAVALERRHANGATHAAAALVMPQALGAERAERGANAQAANGAKRWCPTTPSAAASIRWRPT